MLSALGRWARLSPRLSWGADRGLAFFLKVIRMTGFMKGLYTDVEMKSDNVKVGGRRSRGLCEAVLRAEHKAGGLEFLAASSPQLPPVPYGTLRSAFRNAASVPEVGASPSPKKESFTELLFVVVVINSQEF